MPGAKQLTDSRSARGPRRPDGDVDRPKFGSRKFQKYLLRWFGMAGPTIRHRPLRPGVDDNIFVHREVAERELREAVTTGENVLLLGLPGAGKSTLLNWLVAELEADGRPVAQVQASLAHDVHELLALIDAELPPVFVPAPGAPFDDIDPADLLVRRERHPLPEVVRLAREIKALERPEPAIVVLDELYDPQIAQDLFARARDALWATGHQWVLAARPEQEADLTRPPAGAFWPHRVPVMAMDQLEAAELLRKRGIDPDAVPQRLRSAWRGVTPREALVRATDPRGPNLQHEADEFDDHWAQATPSSSKAMLLDALVALDRPVAADDPELAQRVGWSRAYTQRLLRELVDSGEVQTTTERRTTPGRPKTLYRAPTVPESR